MHSKRPPLKENGARGKLMHRIEIWKTNFGQRFQTIVKCLVSNMFKASQSFCIRIEKSSKKPIDTIQKPERPSGTYQYAGIFWRLEVWKKTPVLSKTGIKYWPFGFQAIGYQMRVKKTLVGKSTVILVNNNHYSVSSSCAVGPVFLIESANLNSDPC